MGMFVGWVFIFWYFEIIEMLIVVGFWVVDVDFFMDWCFFDGI